MLITQFYKKTLGKDRELIATIYGETAADLLRNELSILICDTYSVMEEDVEHIEIQCENCEGSKLLSDAQDNSLYCIDCQTSVNIL